MLEVIGESPAAFAALPVKLPALFGQPSEVGFNIANVQKDLRTITRFADQLAVSTPIVRTVQLAFEQAAKEGLGQEDVAAIVRRNAKI
jgi:3-hydroxyisobutyrate dehydrogenase-like beta-hydroxyacid dehydrogenase